MADGKGQLGDFFYTHMHKALAFVPGAQPGVFFYNADQEPFPAQGAGFLAYMAYQLCADALAAGPGNTVSFSSLYASPGRGHSMAKPIGLPSSI